MKVFITIICLILATLQASCTTTFARMVYDQEGSDELVYPHAPIKEQELQSTDIQLNQYKPVESRPNKKEKFALAVAISGGSYRAANFGLGVMLGLEEIKTKNGGNLLQEVDYFSTVSGGGLPVGFYLARLHNYLECHHNSENFSLAAETNQIFMNDCSCPNPLRADLTSYMFSINEKHALQMEKVLNNRILCTNNGGLTTGDIFVPKDANRAVRLPYWAINTLIYQNAAIFPFTPDVINSYHVTGYYHNNTQYSAANPCCSLGYCMPLSVGLMASMSVPIAFPPTTLESCFCGQKYYLHLYDEGMVDILGVNTALSMLAQDKRETKVLIVVDACKNLANPFSCFKQSPEGIPLVVHLSATGYSGERKLLKAELCSIAKKRLGNKNTKNVIVIYLDLDNYPAAQAIKSRLKMSCSQQQYLINIGKQLVKCDPTLKELR